MNYNYYPYYSFPARSIYPSISSIPSTSLIASRTPFSFNSLLNGASRTLNVINQAIPVINQAKPVWNNMKTMFRVAKEINKPDNNKELSTPKAVNNNNPNFFI